MYKNGVNILEAVEANFSQHNYIEYNKEISFFLNQYNIISLLTFPIVYYAKPVNGFVRINVI